MNISGGQRAIKNAETLKRDVCELIAEKYQEFRKSSFRQARHLEQPVFAKNYRIGESLFGTDWKPHFILYHPKLWKDCLAINCYCQHSSGSTYQKFPYYVESIEDNKISTVIVLDGDAFPKKLREWLDNQKGGNLMGVMTYSEFIAFHRDKL